MSYVEHSHGCSIEARAGLANVKSKKWPSKVRHHVFVDGETLKNARGALRTFATQEAAIEAGRVEARVRNSERIAREYVEARERIAREYVEARHSAAARAAEKGGR